MAVRTLLDGLVARPDWHPVAPPSLDGIEEVALDVETDGLAWWGQDRPIGFSLTLPDGTTNYFPWGHRGGGNLDEQVMHRWAQRELRGKHIVNLNTKFDIHMLYAWGIDLEAQHNTVSDVSHYAALLDDHRVKFNLNSLTQFYLGEEKVGKELDVTRMADYHAGTVAPRAESDTRQVWQLKKKMWPLLDAQDLHRVRAVEDAVIFVVCEMERNGTPIDLELLEQWITDSEQAYLRSLWKIYRATNLNINPASPKDLVKLFGKLQLPIAETPEGRPSFTDSVLDSHTHPVMAQVRTARKLASLRSKYLLKYRDAVGSDGILRYALHQLRAMPGPLDTQRAAGTVTGRFSSTAIQKGVGVNIQQVMTPAKQIAAFGSDQFLIRQLHKPGSGMWLSADAAQIEYRLFAAKARNPKVLQAYADDPTLSFHKLVWDELKKLKPDISYKATKNLNFCKLYGGGIVKIAAMLGMITSEELHTLQQQKAGWAHPKLQGARHALQIYGRVLPEVQQMLKRTSMLAEQQGFVTTVLGRRARLTQHYYKALNREIQGGAADIMKLKLVALHQARKDTGFVMRCTVHDEVDGDAPDAACIEKVNAVLAAPAVDLPIPILWETSTGTTWGGCE